MIQILKGLGSLAFMCTNRLTNTFSTLQMPVICQGMRNEHSLLKSSFFHGWSLDCLSRTMATLNQMHRAGPQKPKPRKKGLLEGRPQLKGVVLKTLIKKPKKPNSANRKCVQVRLSTGREVIAYIPGEGHNLQEHNIVLVEGGRVPDLPGVKLKCIRGKYDLAHVKK